MGLDLLVWVPKSLPPYRVRSLRCLVVVGPWTYVSVGKIPVTKRLRDKALERLVLLTGPGGRREGGLDRPSRPKGRPISLRSGLRGGLHPPPTGGVRARGRRDPKGREENSCSLDLTLSVGILGC